MKKLISIIAALSMIASLSVTSFAAIDASISVTDTAKATLVKQDDGSFTADLAANSNASQDTIVVIKGTNPNDITTTSIEYINQDAASQNFNFVLKNTPDAEEDFTEGNTLTYTVLMGGDTVSKTTVGTITYTFTADVVKYTVTFVGTDGTTPVIEAAQYEKAADIVLPSEEVTATITKAEDENYTYAFAGWATTAGATEAIDVNAYALTADVTFYPVFTATEKEVGGGEDTPIIIQLGDCDGIAGIDLGDASAIVSHYLNEITLTDNAEAETYYNTAAAQADGIAGIDLGDASAVVSHYLNEITLGTYEIK